MRPALAALSVVLLLGACAGEDDTIPAATDAPTEGTTTPASTEGAVAVAADAEEVLADGEVTLSATLSGDAAYPGPGDDGEGRFVGTLAIGGEGQEQGARLCYELQVRGLSAPPAAAHVHRGVAGEAGEVVIPLQAPGDGSADGCVDVRAVDLAMLVEDPTDFYVNVHTDDYPDGAVRGQLSAQG